MKIKLLHIITQIGPGGAEQILVQLLEKIDINKFECIVISLKGGNYFHKKRIEDSGAKLYCLDGERGILFFMKFFTLYRIVKTENPDIIQSWMYHSDFIGFILAKLIKIKYIFWGVHSTKLSFSTSSTLTIFLRKCCTIFSRFTTKIINCSATSIQEHIRIGYKKEKFVYIPNGYDEEVFYLNQSLSIRHEFGLTEDSIVIGLIARFNPEKDHLNFLQGLSEVKLRFPEVRALLAGDGIDNENEYLRNIIKEYGLESNIIMVGLRSDLINIYNTIDFLVLSSVSEAFPNVVAEAMLCEKPCVVTDVGDAAKIIGDTGFVVPIKNPERLSNAICKMMDMSKNERNILGNKARSRILNHYSLNKMVESYESIYLNAFKEI